MYDMLKEGGNMRFKVVIMYDPEYKGYVVDVPELVGCMSQGKTIDEAIENIKDAIRGWIEVQKKHGRFDFDRVEEKEVFLGEVTV
jgi:predicted RNase H-like HicB family nuclease